MRKLKGKADTSPLSKNRMAEHLRMAASALDHGRITTACEKVALVQRELTSLSFTGEMNNQIRADFGACGVTAGNPDHESNDIESSVSDTLANVMHFCKREGIDFQARLSTAEMHFEAESEEEED